MIRDVLIISLCKFHGLMKISNVCISLICIMSDHTFSITSCNVKKDSYGKETIDTTFDF